MSQVNDKLRAYLARFPNAPDGLATDENDWTGQTVLTFGDLRALHAECERREQLLGNAATWLPAVSGLRNAQEIRAVFELAQAIERELLPTADPARTSSPNG